MWRLVHYITCRRAASPKVTCVCELLHDHAGASLGDMAILTPAACVQADLTPRTKELTNTLQKWGADLNKHSLLVTSEVSKQLQLAGACPAVLCACTACSPAP